MPTLFEDGEAFLREDRSENTALTVTLTRDGISNAAVEATPIYQRGEADDGEITVGRLLVGWLIDRAQYTLSATRVEPLPGDLITANYAHGYGSTEYRVIERSGENAFAFHGSDELTFRVNVVQVNAVA